MKDDGARDAYLLWKDSGKPRQGVAYELMRHSRSQNNIVTLSTLRTPLFALLFEHIQSCL